ncbi:DUF3185 family protein [Flavobacterium sp. N1994]|uniref:DUF3185 family protein n=1 Tax=Flavobacterium sp. N1994 TaxID=2986827 RepID=UPI002223615C|nr:DUF3185 family protein [Flavobacterium sp. N1994]
MKTTQIIGILLIGLGVGLCYYGFTKVNENSNQVKVLGLSIDASNPTGQREGYFYLAIGVVAFGAGIYSITKK